MTMLGEFMKDAGWSDQHLADWVGRDRSTITRIRLGRATPSLEVAVQIERLTKGKVPAVSLIQRSVSEPTHGEAA